MSNLHPYTSKSSSIPNIPIRPAHLRQLAMVLRETSEDVVTELLEATTLICPFP
jgi:hypothetical protein